MSSGVYSTQSPFDLKSITKSIEDAVATLRPEEHGAVVVSVVPNSATAALVVRGPSMGMVKSSLLATVTKPLGSGKIGWSVSGRVSFVLGINMPQPSKWAQFLGWYLVLRKFNPAWPAAVKAWKLVHGDEVKLTF